MALTQVQLSELDTDILNLAKAGYTKQLVLRTPERGLHYEVPAGKGCRWFVVIPRRVLLGHTGDVAEILACDIVLGLCFQGSEGSEPGLEGARLALRYENGSRAGGAVILQDEKVLSTLRQNFVRSREIVLTQQPCAFDAETGIALDAEEVPEFRLTDIRHLVAALEKDLTGCIAGNS